MSSREIGRIFRTPHWGKSPDTRVGFHPIAIMPVNTSSFGQYQRNIVVNSDFRKYPIRNRQVIQQSVDYDYNHFITLTDPSDIRLGRLASALFQSGGRRGICLDRRLVCHSHQAVLESSVVAVWPGVEPALCDDGRGSLAGLV